MLQLLSNGNAREINSRSRHYSEPKLGDVYAVVKHAGRFEVRCWSFKRGQQMSDELVDSFEFESAADCVARVLSEGGGGE